VAVCGTSNDLAADGLELLHALAERDDLRRTDERKVHWIEEQDEVLAGVVRETDLLELSVDKSCPGEVRGRLREAREPVMRGSDTAVTGHDVRYVRLLLRLQNTDIIIPQCRPPLRPPPIRSQLASGLNNLDC